MVKKIIILLILFLCVFLSVLAGTGEEAWIKHGNSMYKQKKYSEALAAYEKAIEINPENNHALKNAGYCYAVLGQNETALEYLNMYFGRTGDVEAGIYIQTLEKRVNELENQAAGVPSNRPFVSMDFNPRFVFFTLEDVNNMGMSVNVNWSRAPLFGMPMLLNAGFFYSFNHRDPGIILEHSIDANIAIGYNLINIMQIDRPVSLFLPSGSNNMFHSAANPLFLELRGVRGNLVFRITAFAGLELMAGTTSHVNPYVEVEFANNCYYYDLLTELISIPVRNFTDLYLSARMSTEDIRLSVAYLYFIFNYRFNYKGTNRLELGISFPLGVFWDLGPYEKKQKKEYPIKAIPGW